LVESLELDGFSGEFKLNVTANLTDGTPVKGTDCIEILENVSKAKDKAKVNGNLILAVPLLGLVAFGFTLRKR
ncbi:MAG: hypothetical protein ACOC5C_06610, partial [Halobacteriota archaeon]